MWLGLWLFLLFLLLNYEFRLEFERSISFVLALGDVIVLLLWLLFIFFLFCLGFLLDLYMLEFSYYGLGSVHQLFFHFLLLLLIFLLDFAVNLQLRMNLYFAFSLFLLAVLFFHNNGFLFTCNILFLIIPEDLDSHFHIHGQFLSQFLLLLLQFFLFL